MQSGLILYFRNTCNYYDCISIAINNREREKWRKEIVVRVVLKKINEHF